MKKHKNRTSPSWRLRKRSLWVSDTWAETEVCTKDEQEFASTAVSQILSWEEHDIAEELQEDQYR